MNQPKLEISSFILETTRRCNMNCDHCLRGGPGSGDMSPELLRVFLKQVQEIDEVTFTGGEPSLNIPIMRTFYDICEEYNIPIHSFFVATNGKENQMELATFLLEQYEKSDYQEGCAVALSIDAFHEEDISNLVKGLAFYTNIKEHPIGDFDWPIAMGTADMNGLGIENPRIIRDHFQIERMENQNLRVEDLYLSINGCVFPECNLTNEEENAPLDSPNDCPTEFIKADTASEQLNDLYETKQKEKEA